jgi:molybdate transport system substrate-binding protein
VLLTMGVGLSVLAAGCSAQPTQPAGASRTPAQTLTVFAAASLTAPFTTLGRLFEEQHPGSSVLLNFAGSSSLVAQLDQGAVADVLATADAVTMADADAARLLSGPPITFATNSLTIAVPPTNPARIGSFADLDRDGVRLVVCLPTVPCGAATEQVERNTGVTLRPVSEESSVTEVLTKVAVSEADAGVVYRSDITRADGRVADIAIPDRDNAVNQYQLSTLRRGTAPELARLFQDLVAGAQGQRILHDAGFGSR